MKCSKCGSYVINPGSHGRGDDHPELCDVCYWRTRLIRAEQTINYIEWEMEGGTGTFPVVWRKAKMCIEEYRSKGGDK